jgi:hypothetical protein
MIHQRTAVTTEDDHQPGVTGNLFETDVAATAIGGCGGEEAGDMEGWQCINEESKVEGGGGAPAVSAYPCKHHPGKDMHRSRIYLGKGTRASKGGGVSDAEDNRDAP